MPTVTVVTLPFVLSVIYILTLGGASVTRDSPQVEGTYELVSAPGDPAYNAYLEALGVGDAFRQVMTRLTVKIQIEKTGENTYKYKIETPLTTRETTFKFGDEIEDKYIDGRKYKTIFMPEGDSVKQLLNFGNVTGTSIYKFTHDGLTATQTANDKVAIREYKRTHLPQ